MCGPVANKNFMPSGDLLTSRNAAQVADRKKSKNENTGNDEARGSIRIREAGGILRDLLLGDEYGRRNLGSMVKQRLDELQLELEQLAGTQELFERWVGE